MDQLANGKAAIIWDPDAGRPKHALIFQDGQGHEFAFSDVRLSDIPMDTCVPITKCSGIMRSSKKPTDIYIRLWTAGFAYEIHSNGKHYQRDESHRRRRITDYILLLNIKMKCGMLVSINDPRAQKN